MTTLVIVESPTKAKTISKFLGNNYIVKASFGHVIDLDKKNLGIDINNNFKPTYKILPDKSKIIKELLELSKKVNNIYLASDEDREGEAISYHLANILKLDLNNFNRITFHEITKNAISNAINNPKKIDLNLVNSQQTRRILDRLVGFKISPILWKNVNNNLSAGRVQSVCLKLIIDNENNISDFNFASHFKTKAFFNKNIVATLNKNFSNKDDAINFIQNLYSSSFIIGNIEKSIEEKKPFAPYTTSTIVQDINNKLHISPKIIMDNLQHLYENGYITYHRTDSTNLSEHILANIKEFVLNKYGNKYYQRRLFKSQQKNAQEAHEAIRPTNINITELDNDSSNIQKKIYKNIWNRTVASQMSNALYEKFSIIINFDNNITDFFVANTMKNIFDGFTIIYEINKSDDDDDLCQNITDIIHKNEILFCNNIVSEQKYLTPPPRYSDGSLVKKLEKLGIGRPSTYANIIETILKRNYVIRSDIKGVDKDSITLNFNFKNKTFSDTNKTIKIGYEKNKLCPTQLGIITNEFLNNHFKKIMDYKYTSILEDKLDNIANGKDIWTNIIKEFYSDIDNDIENLNTKKNNKKLLGNKNNINYFIYISKYGPVIQIGDDNDPDKKYINLDKNTDINTFNFDDINNIIVYPHILGNFNNFDIIVKNGKFGHYFTHNNINYTIEDINNFNIDSAINIINNKSNSKTKIGKFDIINGKYGYYFTHNKINISIPKNIDINNLNEDILNKLINDKVNNDNTNNKKFTKKYTKK